MDTSQCLVVDPKRCQKEHYYHSQRQDGSNIHASKGKNLVVVAEVRAQKLLHQKIGHKSEKIMKIMTS